MKSTRNLAGGLIVPARHGAHENFPTGGVNEGTQQIFVLACRTTGEAKRRYLDQIEHQTCVHPLFIIVVPSIGLMCFLPAT